MEIGNFIRRFHVCRSMHCLRPMPLVGKCLRLTLAVATPKHSCYFEYQKSTIEFDSSTTRTSIQLADPHLVSYLCWCNPVAAAASVVGVGLVVAALV